MRPTISEFSYGFALTRELLLGPGVEVTAAPVFPTTIAEGQEGGGWDVRLDRPGVPLFLQFKLCDRMVSSHCREARDAGFTVPCYRMYIRSSRVSRQHRMLLALEHAGQEVYYSAPRFHRIEELNDAFARNEVRIRSVWIRPSEIGELDDDDEHHVSFGTQGSSLVVLSEPKYIEGGRQFDHVVEDLQRMLAERRRVELARDNLEKLADVVQEIVEEPERSRSAYQATRVDREDIGGEPALQRISYLASVFLGCQLFVVQQKR